jgi:hypothetical protein
LFLHFVLLFLTSPKTRRGSFFCWWLVREPKKVIFWMFHWKNSFALQNCKFLSTFVTWKQWSVPHHTWNLLQYELSHSKHSESCLDFQHFPLISLILKLLLLLLLERRQYTTSPNCSTSAKGYRSKFNVD